MKTGIVFLIHWLVIFIIVYVWSLLFAQPLKPAGSKILNALGLSLILAVVIWLLQFAKVQEGFMFEVSPAKEKCMKEQVSTDSNDRTCGCCPKDTTGVGSCSPFPMTEGNWPYRADQVLPNQKLAVPPTESCNLGAFEATKDPPMDKLYPPKYSTLEQTGEINLEENYEPQRAQHVQQAVDPRIEAIKNANIEMFAMENCPACKRTKEMLKNEGLEQFVTYKDAKENLDFLKEQGVKAVPFLKAETGTCEGACKDAADLIEKLKIKIDSFSAPKTTIENFLPSEQYTGPRDGYVFKQDAAGLGYYRDNYQSPTVNENFHQQAAPAQQQPAQPAQPAPQQQPQQQPPAPQQQPQQQPPAPQQVFETFARPQAQTPQQIMNATGKLNEAVLEHFVETYVPNYKGREYLTKPSQYTGYYSYENYLPDSVRYGSLAGQVVPPAPCGHSQEGTR